MNIGGEFATDSGLHVFGQASASRQPKSVTHSVGHECVVSVVKEDCRQANIKCVGQTKRESRRFRLIDRWAKTNNTMSGGAGERYLRAVMAFSTLGVRVATACRSSRIDCSSSGLIISRKRLLISVAGISSVSISCAMRVQMASSKEGCESIP